MHVRDEICSDSRIKKAAERLIVVGHASAHAAAMRGTRGMVGAGHRCVSDTHPAHSPIFEQVDA